MKDICCRDQGYFLEPEGRDIRTRLRTETGLACLETRRSLHPANICFHLCFSGFLCFCTSDFAECIALNYSWVYMSRNSWEKLISLNSSVKYFRRSCDYSSSDQVLALAPSTVRRGTKVIDKNLASPVEVWTWSVSGKEEGALLECWDRWSLSDNHSSPSHFPVMLNSICKYKLSWGWGLVCHLTVLPMLPDPAWPGYQLILIDRY